MDGNSALPVGWADPDLSAGGPVAWRALRRMRRATLQRFLDDCAEPQAAAEAAAARVIDASRDTAFREHMGFSAVRDLDTFRARVPVVPMKEHEPWLRRAATEGSGVLTRHAHLAYNRTSGTTGTPKDLPVTQPWATAVSEAQAVWVAAMVAEDPSVAALGARALTTVGRAREAVSSDGLDVGSNTGRMHHAQPWWVKLRYALPSSVYSLPTLELRQYVALRLALAVDVRTWTTANPSSILALCRAMTRWREALSADLVDGTLRRGPAASLSASDRRAFKLWIWRKRSLPDDWRPAAFWPNLRSLNCWKGGSAPFFLSRVPDALGRDVPIREVGVSASEGHIAVPLHSSWWGGVVHVGGHLVELAPVDGGEPVLPHDADLGGLYRVVLSTTAGLYRCDLGDIIKVEGLFLRTPVVRFLRRAGEVISLTGEKVTGEQLVQALSSVLPAAGVGFAVHGVLQERPHLAVAVEAPVTEGLAARFDQALSALNGEYESKRSSGRYEPPRIHCIPAGAFDRWRAERVEGGAADAQVKDPITVSGHVFERLVQGWGPS